MDMCYLCFKWAYYSYCVCVVCIRERERERERVTATSVSPDVSLLQQLNLSQDFFIAKTYLMLTVLLNSLFVCE